MVDKNEAAEKWTLSLLATRYSVDPKRENKGSGSIIVYIASDLESLESKQPGESADRPWY